MPHLVPCLLLIGIVAIWGWTFSLMKAPVEAYGVVPFLAVRFGMATVVLLAASWRRLSWRTLKTGGAIGVVLAAAYLFQTFGLERTTPTNTGIITGLFVVFAPVLNRLIFGVRTSALLFAAIVVSLAGLLLLTGTGPTPLAAGDALVFVCAACYGLQFVLLERHAKHHDAVCLATAQVGISAVILLAIWPFAAPIRLPETTPLATRGEVWFALLVTALLASAAAAIVQTYVQQRITAVQTAIIVAAEPVFAAFFGYLCAGDRLTALQVVGAALMIGAIALSEIVPAWRGARK